MLSLRVVRTLLEEAVYKMYEAGLCSKRRGPRGEAQREREGGVIMPTNLQCTRCGSRFYTASDRRFLTESACQACGGPLAVLDAHEAKEGGADDKAQGRVHVAGRDQCTRRSRSP